MILIFAGPIASYLLLVFYAGTVASLFGKEVLGNLLPEYFVILQIYYVVCLLYYTRKKLK